MRKNPDYYRCLGKLEDKATAEFSQIILMDVKRTPEAAADEEHSRKLTAVLVNYAK